MIQSNIFLPVHLDQVLKFFLLDRSIHVEVCLSRFATKIFESNDIWSLVCKRYKIPLESELEHFDTADQHFSCNFQLQQRVNEEFQFLNESNKIWS